MAASRLDPQIAKALGDFISTTGKAIASAAADAAIDEVRHRLRDGVAKVDGGLEKTQRKVRGARSRKAPEPEVVDADFEETSRRRR